MNDNRRQVMRCLYEVAHAWSYRRAAISLSLFFGVNCQDREGRGGRGVTQEFTRARRLLSACSLSAACSLLETAIYSARARRSLVCDVESKIAVGDICAVVPSKRLDNLPPGDSFFVLFFFSPRNKRFESEARVCTRIFNATIEWRPPVCILVEQTSERALNFLLDAAPRINAKL